eukprot:4578474-Pyramimonas_sp.AAC.1
MPTSRRSISDSTEKRCIWSSSPEEERPSEEERPRRLEPEEGGVMSWGEVGEGLPPSAASSP